MIAQTKHDDTVLSGGVYVLGFRMTRQNGVGVGTKTIIIVEELYHDTAIDTRESFIYI